MSKKIQLIVGLGNPDKEHGQQRHNAGKWLLRKIAKKFKSDFNLRNKFHGNLASINYGDRKIYLFHSNLYMNLSGVAVKEIINFYKINIQDMLVIHDELDLKCGKIKLKSPGGSNGHNGLKNVEKEVGSNKFYRLKIGINRPIKKTMVASYVLKAPSVEENILINESIDLCAFYFDDLIQGKFQSFTNKIQKG